MSAYFRHLVEYRVADLPRELTFWGDGVGLETVLEEPEYAILARPGAEFRLALRRVPATAATPPAAVSVQFWCEDLSEAVTALANRGLQPIEAQGPYSAEHPGIMTCGFRAPSGISFRLWSGR